ncbi:DNA primase [Persephonella sp.]
MAISPDTIEEVRRTANVYDVISEYLNLEKTGSNYKSLCPFHSEKTPSFIVSPQKNLYKCFGCGKSGTALSFLMDYEGLSFSDAIIKLANKYNIPVKFTKSEIDTEHLKDLYTVSEKIVKFYKNQLMNSLKGKKFLYERDIRTTTADYFNIGYSPENINDLIDFCKKEDIPIEKLKEIGIINVYDNGKISDKFRGRIVFPIRDHRGRYVAFGGRSLSNNQQPKYLNSPETKIYSKSKVLYGFFEAKDQLREKKWAVIVEGYMDLLSLYQVGVKNVVATLGTAFTEDQGELLKKFVNKAILMFDSDKAGKKASIRTAKILYSKGIDVYYAPLEDGKDPDDIAKEGSKKVDEVIKNSKDFLAFLLEKIKVEKELKKKGEIIDLYLEMVSQIPDKTKQGLLIKKLSEETGLQESYLEIKKNENFKKEEKIELSEYLSKNEQIILKTLVLNKEELLKRFDKFDKIEGSGNFELLVREILNKDEIDDEIRERILQFPVESNVEAALFALERKYILWKKKEVELYLSMNINVDDEFLIQLKEDVKKTLLGGSVRK